MAIPKSPPPTLQLVAVFSRHLSALSEARDWMQQSWGNIVLQSEAFEHDETEYYAREMGQELRKQFFILDGCYDPAKLATAKLESNRWEQQVAQVANYPEIRPVNMDPGYLTLHKLVLASAKDRAHRIYLRDGIYAEECLYYLDQRWQPRPWTYPDYTREDFQRFFEQARELLKQMIASQQWSKN